MHRVAGLFIVTMVCAVQVAAQDTTSFDRHEAMVPMRDGVKLHTSWYVPRNITGPLPIIFSRTPYGIEHADGAFRSYYQALVKEGYLFAFQDIRGRFGSEGTFVMQRKPDHRQTHGSDESTDAYDTIDWMIHNIPNNNGRVGMLGISYDGWTTGEALIDPHPALRAASPQASPDDMFLNDDFHHQGAFRLSYGFEYAVLTEASDTNSSFDFGRYDTYDWYLELGPLRNANARYLHDKLPSWNNFVAHPNHDDFWKVQALTTYLHKTTVPTLNVAGWWDQEDFVGPIQIYEAMEPRDSAGVNFLVVGPWNHGGWAGGPGRQLGNIDFASNTGEYFRDSVQAPFFAHFLKDKGPLNLPEALTFESGANTWVRNDAWPARAHVTRRRLYFRENRGLSFAAPAARAPGGAFDRYVSDPASPVPYRNRPIQPTYYAKGSGWYTWLLQDQRFVDHRPDVLSWETPPLEEDVVIRGAITAHLFASTTGSDADWIVKLIDVYPEDYENAAAPRVTGGYELMVANDVLRGRFRTGFERPAAIVPNRALEYMVDLHTQDYRFLKGHRIMVQVQSTWFPIIDRNPQTFVPNIFEAKASDFRTATHRIYRSGAQASYVELPIYQER
ncbi:MAG: X-Pro dipeptidyl-peptidase [Gemmatimonadetes bacterium]|nr:MAG: X-Pro dipeptidyl-peptidase [Gemmatimonadota bacterium]